MNERIPQLVLKTKEEPEIIYNVIFETFPSVNEKLYEILENLIEVFVETGKRGGFAFATVSPSQSSLVYTYSESPTSTIFSFKIDACYVDVRAFQFIRNMALRLRLKNIFVKRISVLGDGIHEDRLAELAEPTENNEEYIYPEISVVIDVGIVWEESEFSKSRRCLVEMKDNILASHVRGIAEWIEPWYLLLEAGAFALPHEHPGETYSFRGSVVVFDEITAEISVDRFQASESAWYVLINLLDAYSKKFALIDKVIID